LNLILILKELWRKKLQVALAAVAAAVLAIVAVFNVSPSPPFVSKRTESYAQGSIEILVDSARSPIADAQKDLTGLTSRAAVFARYMSGGDVIAKIAKANHLKPKQIDIEGTIALPSAAPGVEEPGPRLHPYGISVTSAGELPILTVVTRAPTVAVARGLATAAPRAIREEVETIQDQQETPQKQRVEFRVLGPSQAAVVDDAKGKKIAVLLFVVLFSLFVVIIVGWPRFKAAWRSAEPDVAAAPPQSGAPEEGNEVLQLPPAMTEAPRIESPDSTLIVRQREQ
jgi:hypothetical protein